MKSNSWKTVLAIVMSFGLMVSGVVMSFEGVKSPAIIATYTAAAVCLLFSFIERVEAFKVFGLHAQLRKKLNEADEILAQLQGVLKPLSEMVFTLAARVGRWDSAIPRKDQFRLTSDFRRQLVEIGLGEQEVDELAKDWLDTVARDLAFPLIEQITNRIQVRQQDIVERQREYPQPIRGDDPVWRALHDRSQSLADIAMEARALAAEPAPIRSFIRSCQIFSEDEQGELLSNGAERLDELEYFLQHKKFRNPEKWLIDDPLIRGLTE